jgi:tripartite-type tricarboxylate transporter receptor subunit TctC
MAACLLKQIQKFFRSLGTSFTAMPGLYQKLPFDPVADFDAVITVTAGAYTLAVSSALPFMSVAELVAHAKANPGTLTYGSAGVATASHLAGELFKSMAGIQITHIPYKGAAPASVDLLGGHISCAFPGVSLVLPHYRSGRMRLIGTTSAQRSATLPEVPTLAEGGLKGFEVISWYGLLAPAALPVELVSRLHHEVVRGLAEVDAIERLQAIGVGASAITTAEFAAFLNREQEKWARVIRSAGLQAQ